MSRGSSPATGRLDETLARASSAGRKLLVTYACVGDPSLEESVELLAAAVESGADVLELGVPFSDPTADGPAIARASQRAIRAGATLPRVIEVAAALRARFATPMVLFGYYNPILVHGEEAAVALAAAAGIDALLIVDLPPDEGPVLRAAAKAAGLPVIPLVAPTSNAARVAELTRGVTGGFLYYVSVTGVTGSLGDGATTSPLAAASAQAAALRRTTGLPVVVGFGIDGPTAAREAAGPPDDGADGVVVGTAIVRRIEEGNTAADRVAAVRALVTSLRTALDR
jgi:tryptophan synthase alpha chain